MIVTKSIEIGIEIVSVSVEADLEHLAIWLLDVLLKMHNNGSPIEDGKVIEIGWSMLFIRRQVDGVLLVCEPDFMGNPFSEEINGATYTLKYQSIQMGFADQLKISPKITKFQEKLIIDKDLKSFEKIYMVRGDSQSLSRDSGWYVGVQRGEEGWEGELTAIYSYEFLREYPSLFPALILPVGFMVMINNEKIVSVMNSNNEIIM